MMHKKYLNLALEVLENNNLDPKFQWEYQNAIADESQKITIKFEEDILLRWVNDNYYSNVPNKNKKRIKYFYLEKNKKIYEKIKINWLRKLSNIYPDIDFNLYANSINSHISHSLMDYYIIKKYTVGSRVLDFGAGFGRNAQIFIDNGYKYHALEAIPLSKVCFSLFNEELLSKKIIEYHSPMTISRVVGKYDCVMLNWVAYELDKNGLELLINVLNNKTSINSYVIIRDIPHSKGHGECVDKIIHNNGWGLVKIILNGKYSHGITRVYQKNTKSKISQSLIDECCRGDFLINQYLRSIKSIPVKIKNKLGFM